MRNMSHLAFSHLFFSQLSNRFRCSFRHLLSIHVIDVYVLCISDKNFGKCLVVHELYCIFQTLIRLFVDPKHAHQTLLVLYIHLSTKVVRK